MKLKKLWYWIAGKPWIEYIGNDLYCVKVRDSILTVQLDTSLYKWYGEYSYWKLPYDTAVKVYNDYLKTNSMIIP